MRIRTIRPEFWESPQVGSVSVNARLTFIGLWNLADREGRLKDRPEHIAIKLFPYEHLKPSRLEAWLGELQRQGLIVRYQHAGEAYIAIPTWRRHQRPHPHEAPSELPPPSNERPRGPVAEAPISAAQPAACAGSTLAPDDPSAAPSSDYPRPGASVERSGRSPVCRAADKEAATRRFKPAICRLSAVLDEKLARRAVTFNGAPRVCDPASISVNAQLSNLGTDPQEIDPDDVYPEAQTQPRHCAAAATDSRAGPTLVRDAPAAPPREGEWEEQDAWLKRFLRREQKAFVNAHLEPLLADYAFWCRLSEAAGGLSREFLEVEFAKMALWLGEHPTRGPAANGVKRFVARWVERAAQPVQRRMQIGD